ncbi:MAG: hypothetical protein FWC89_11075, partial [Defluviitaleaceae bacterium]|nr:hypothetical protein [Defluviitaleaceae bacterium]
NHSGNSVYVTSVASQTEMDSIQQVLQPILDTFDLGDAYFNRIQTTVGLDENHRPTPAIIEIHMRVPISDEETTQFVMTFRVQFNAMGNAVAFPLG